LFDLTRESVDIIRIYENILGGRKKETGTGRTRAARRSIACFFCDTDRWQRRGYGWHRPKSHTIGARGLESQLLRATVDKRLDEVSPVENSLAKLGWVMSASSKFTRSNLTSEDWPGCFVRLFRSVVWSGYCWPSFWSGSI